MKTFEKFEHIASTYGVPRDELVELVGAAQHSEWHIGYKAGFAAGRRERNEQPTTEGKSHAAVT